jgi:hypothetical protein
MMIASGGRASIGQIKFASRLNANSMPLALSLMQIFSSLKIGPSISGVMSNNCNAFLLVLIEYN